MKFNKGETIFAKGKHDGSILIVAAGKGALSIHSDDGRSFKRVVGRGETLMSGLSILAMLVGTAPATEKHLSPLLESVCARLSAVAETDNTIVFQIQSTAIRRVAQAYPDSLFRTAQVALSQLEKITAKSLIDHFGLSGGIIHPTPLVHPLLMGGDDERPGGIRNRANFKDYVDSIAEAIGLEDPDMRATLMGCVHVMTFKTHETIEDASSSEMDVYVVLDGHISVQVFTHQQTFAEMYVASRGCELGMMSCFVGTRSVMRMVCSTEAVVLRIPHALFCSLLHISDVSIRCAHHLVAQYSPLVTATDSSFDWLHLHSGESLFDRGDLCDSVYTIISGRLRAIQSHSHRGKDVETTSELVRGATLGALDMLAAGRSNASVFAIRDSQIARMSRNVFDYIVCLHPTVLIHFTTNLANHLPRQRIENVKNDPSGVKRPRSHLLSLGSTMNQSQHLPRSRSLPLGTIAVLSLTKMTKVQTFCSHLLTSLKTLAVTDAVSSQKASAFLGGQWISRSRVARANLSSWLGDIESANEIVIYEADAQLTAWTKLCIRQADHILLLCSDSEPQQAFLEDMAAILQSAWERKNTSISVVRIRDKNWTLTALKAAAEAAASDSSRANTLRKKLRMLMNRPMLPRFILPMEKYEWISCFHNVQFPFEEHQSDFLRLCRRITGNAVGLVLGGGGARGLAHIGVLQALEECGIHVDVVGGTSIGAFIGAMYALHPHELSLVEAKTQEMSNAFSSITEKLRDLTLPIASFFNGKRFNHSIQTQFYDLAIEDLMLNYFCITTDIAKSRMSVHRSGHVWKYVRASMSLQGYFPPISEEGSLLLDGGYMNNLPADVMKEEGGIRYIVAVDVGSEPRRDYYAYGTALSGWWLLWNKLNPFAQTVIVPSMGDVSSALAYVSSEQHKERMMAECIDLYLRPPVNGYGTLQFDKMSEIIQVGYDYALPRVREWAAGVLSAEPDADIVGQSPTKPMTA